MKEPTRLTGGTFECCNNINKIIIFNFIERAFGEQLETFFRSILKNGIPNYNITPLDPLVYKDNISTSEIKVPGVMT